jgi:hypothetical protein
MICGKWCNLLKDAANKSDYTAHGVGRQDDTCLAKKVEGGGNGLSEGTV